MTEKLFKILMLVIIVAVFAAGIALNLYIVKGGG
jgi:membrane protein insertase Oxa1/YidC/SpoIIIJ